jgi:hypothetical protein
MRWQVDQITFAKKYNKNEANRIGQESDNENLILNIIKIHRSLLSSSFKFSILFAVKESSKAPQSHKKYF